MGKKEKQIYPRSRKEMLRIKKAADKKRAVAGSCSGRICKASVHMIYLNMTGK